MSLQIKSITELKMRLSEPTEILECYIALNHGLRSAKQISYNGETFYVVHEIDDTEQSMSEKELLDSNIGTALKAGALYKY